MEFNGVYSLAAQIHKRIRTYCRPLSFGNDDPIFDISIAGSMCCLNHRSRNFGVFCKHQLGKGPSARNALEVMIAIDGNAVFPITRADFETKERPGSQLEDLVIVEFPSAPELDGNFLKLDLSEIPDLSSVPPERVIAAFGVGFPSQFTTYDPKIGDDSEVEGVNIISRWANLIFTVAESQPTDPAFTRALQLHSRMVPKIRDPDGLSGTSIFFLYRDTANESKIGYAGMATHGNGSGRFLIYDAIDIKRAVELYMND